MYISKHIYNIYNNIITNLLIRNISIIERRTHLRDYGVISLIVTVTFYIVIYYIYTIDAIYNRILETMEGKKFIHYY